MPMARSSGGPAGGGAAPSPHPSPIYLSQGGGGIQSMFPMPKAGGGGSHQGFAPGSTAPIASNSRGGGGGFAGNPMPKAQMGGGQTSLGGGGGPTGGAPAPIRAGGGGSPGGSSGGPAIAVAPSIPRASGGGSGSGSPAGGGGGEGARGNPDANNNPHGRPSLDAQKDVDFGPYMADLQRRIKRAWFPPKGQESRRVVVIFKIHSDGSLSHLRLDHTSGMAIADQAALKAVENAAPFRPLPSGAPTDVDIQFTFDYNVFGGGGRGTFRQF